MASSWKTTLCGVCVLFSALAAVGVALLDGDPATNPDFAHVIQAAVGLGLLFSKDHDK